MPNDELKKEPGEAPPQPAAYETAPQSPKEVVETARAWVASSANRAREYAENISGKFVNDQTKKLAEQALRELRETLGDMVNDFASIATDIRTGFDEKRGHASWLNREEIPYAGAPEREPPTYTGTIGAELAQKVAIGRRNLLEQRIVWFRNLDHSHGPQILVSSSGEFRGSGQVEGMLQRCEEKPMAGDIIRLTDFGTAETFDRLVEITKRMNGVRDEIARIKSGAIENTTTAASQYASRTRLQDAERLLSNLEQESEATLQKIWQAKGIQELTSRLGITAGEESAFIRALVQSEIEQPSAETTITKAAERKNVARDETPAEVGIKNAEADAATAEESFYRACIIDRRDDPHATTPFETVPEADTTQIVAFEVYLGALIKKAEAEMGYFKAKHKVGDESAAEKRRDLYINALAAWQGKGYGKTHLSNFLTEFSSDKVYADEVSRLGKEGQNREAASLLEARAMARVRIKEFAVAHYLI